MKSLSRSISAIIALPRDTSLRMFCPHGLFSAKNSAIRYNQRTISRVSRRGSRNLVYSSMAGNSKSDETEPIDKPCRACTDFQTWAKGRKKEKENPVEDVNSLGQNAPRNEGLERRPQQCPLSRDALGRSSWDFLHTMAAYYPEKPTEKQKSEVNEFLKLFSHFYPCNECAEDLQRQIERFPPKTDSQHELSQWLCRVHNRINLRLGKALFDCSTINERWRDGWGDGSCD